MACDILSSVVDNICKILQTDGDALKCSDVLKRTKYKRIADLTLTCDNILQRLITTGLSYEPWAISDLISKNCSTHEISFDLSSDKQSECPICSALKIVINSSRNWPLHIEKCQMKNNQLAIHFERAFAFQNIIKSVLAHEQHYGVTAIKNQGLFIKSSHDNVFEDIKDLSELRLMYVKQCVSDVAKLAGYHILNERQSEDDVGIFLTLKSGVQTEENVKVIVCGVVINAESGVKETKLQAKDYLKCRISDMKMMAVHKYGDEVSEDSTWSNLLMSLGEAAVKMELLCVKPSQTVILNLQNSSKDSKGATFVLYNYARISSILHQFHKKEGELIYPALPSLDDIEFALLADEEEWELLHFIMEYPLMVLNSVRDIEKGSIKPHFICAFLCKLCKIFSAYYRRIRILREPRLHMMPAIFARIYLLKAIKIVMHNSLALLGIKPVDQM